MPKLEKLSGDRYRYKCSCGTEMELHTKEKPKRVPKCWDCLEKNLYKTEVKNNEKK